MASKSPQPKAPPANSSLSNRAVAQRRRIIANQSSNVSRGTSRPAPAPAPAPAAAPSPPPTNQQKFDAASAKASQIAPTHAIGRQNYQPIILMEYVGCLLLTVTTPVATKKQANGLSPYAGADMVKIAAITLLYFILAAISVGGRGPGRFAAWFGGLILIVDGMYEASNLAKDFGLFTGGLAAAASAGAGGTSAPGQPAPAVGVNNPSLVQNVINAATNPPGFGQ